MAIKRILGGKSKNLFDIDKFVDTPYVKRSGNSLICSAYGTPIGTLESLCPTLKASDTITISFKCTSEGVASNFININNRIFGSGSTFIASELGLSNPIYLYSTDYAHRDIRNKTTYSNIQLELGSTATEYVPHELTSYKSIMKVSEVCQLIDKNKIPTTRTISGVTFTNNGDGSVTVNGTSTHQYYSEIAIPIDGLLFIPGHVYLNGTVEGLFAGFVALYGPVAKDYIMYPQQIYTLPSGKDFNKFRYIIRVITGKTVDNYTTKPQLFDLTEMFGAGNEPKTVTEFRAKFPNDYYPYSPSCFVTSFDERMPCKTKNLFNYKNSDSTAKTITSHGVTLSLKNDYFELYGTQQEDKYFECSLTQFNIPFTAGKTYILSLDNAIPRLEVVYFSGFYNDDTTKQFNLLRVQGTNNNPLQTFTPTKNGYFSQIVVYSSKNHRFSGNYNMRVQIEENSHKSEYVPHNYV